MYSYRASNTWTDTKPATRAAGGPNNFETLSGIDQQQEAAMQILNVTIPLQYSKGGTTALMTTLNPNRRSNPMVTPLEITPQNSLRYARLAGQAPVRKPVYGNAYYSLDQGYD